MKDVHKVVSIIVLLAVLALLWLVWRDHTAIGNAVADGVGRVGSAFDQFIYPLKTSADPFVQSAGSAIAKPVDSLTAAIVGGLYTSNSMAQNAAIGSNVITLGGL